jgi:hypothetical protein
MLQNVTFADILSTYSNPDLYDEISELLRQRINSMKESDKQERQILLRILVLGWYLFARSGIQ